MEKKLVEVARSFSLKKNLGNYESVDFFASQKAEVPEEEAEAVSEKLYQFCKAECVKSLNEYMKSLQQPDDGEYGNLPEVKEVKVYKAKDTDPWRKPSEVKYMASGTKEKPEKVEITEEILENNTSKPK